MILPIDKKFDRVIDRSLVRLLTPRGYHREGSQFYFHSERVGKLITIHRELDHPHYRQVAIFTLRVQVASDDFWAFYHPNEPNFFFPFPPHYPFTLYRHLGSFYGKRRGDQWLSLDMLMPEEAMISYLRKLLSTRILPYLDGLNSIDNVLNAYENGRPSSSRMQLLAWLGRRVEAHRGS